MRKLVYYVAISIDGFISGIDDDVSGFVSEGSGVARYINDLASFDTVIMGRNTYEFGYQYGVQPGQPSPVYAHMTHYIFSDTLTFDTLHEKVHIKKVRLDEVDRLRQTEGSAIYLCGGGQFAGWLLDNQRIDILKLKVSPVLLGQGVKLFGESRKGVQLELVDHESHDRGLQIMTYTVHY